MCIPLELKDALKEHLRTFEKKTQQFDLQSTPSLSTQFLRMYHRHPIFRNPDIRQAFNYAINKEYIATYVLKGEGHAAKNGFVPPFLKNYLSANIKGKEFDPDKAKELLSKAGYPEGKKFPDIILHVTARERDQQIAGIVQKMLDENLNVKIKIATLPLAQLIESFENGESAFWLSRWGADYPDPENFLNIFHGAHIPTDPFQKSHLNSERYFSFQYDSLLDAANLTIDENERFRLYESADQLLVDDAVIIPLFYSENYRLVKPYIIGFEINGMDYRDLRKVYFDKKGVTKNPA
jgi:peptide/nickel transport system substrate-binding protein